VIGYTANADPEAMSAIATAGGGPFPDYLTALTQTELEDAFWTIADSVLSCKFDIEEPEPTADPDKVNFYFDGTDLIPYNEDCPDGTGWTWTDATHTMIQLCDDSCDTLQEGGVTEVVAKFGCPTIIR
jgi:hypothetical protein